MGRSACWREFSLTRNFHDETMLDVCRQQTIVQQRSKAAKGETMRAISGWSLGALAWGLCVPTLARAQDLECGDASAIVREAYPNADADGELTMRAGNRTLTLPSPSSINPHAIVCRRWRGRPGLLLVAVPLIAEVGVDSTLGDLDVLVVDEATGTPRQRLRMPTPWTTTLSGFPGSRSTLRPTSSDRIDWRLG